MLVGAVATMACRPDLRGATQAGAVLFLLFYLVFLAGMELTATPGYVERVWNLGDLTGWRILGLPVEELLFAVSFGAYWAGLYEHVTWRRSRTAGRGGSRRARARLPKSMKEALDVV